MSSHLKDPTPIIPIFLYTFVFFNRVWVVQCDSNDDILMSAMQGNTNTGFTSYLSTNGMPVPALSAELVMAHELGHSYGSLHDPNTPLCSPDNEHGGVYLLNTYAVSGLMPNHYVSH